MFQFRVLHFGNGYHRALVASKLTVLVPPSTMRRTISSKGYSIPGAVVFQFTLSIYQLLSFPSYHSRGVRLTLVFTHQKLARHVSCERPYIHGIPSRSNSGWEWSGPSVSWDPKMMCTELLRCNDWSNNSAITINRPGCIPTIHFSRRFSETNSLPQLSCTERSCIDLSYPAIALITRNKYENQRIIALFRVRLTNRPGSQLNAMTHRYHTLQKDRNRPPGRSDILDQKERRLDLSSHNSIATSVNHTN